MQRVVILGGGVGGTLTANLLVKKLGKQIAAGDVEVMVVDATGDHVYQPGFMYIAMGGERAENLQRPERSLLDKRVTLLVTEVESAEALEAVLRQRPVNFEESLRRVAVTAASERLAQAAREAGFMRITIAADARPASLLRAAADAFV